jgi:hypothetical protein
MRCPSCGRPLNKAEQLWLTTHGGKQCSHCRAGAQLPRRGRGQHLHPSQKKGISARRGDRRLTD